MRLGELTDPDDRTLRNPRKIIRRTSVQLTADEYKFFLPSHKADVNFEGNTIVVLRKPTCFEPHALFVAYLASRDRRFPFSSPLWLKADGTIPTRTFFINRLRRFFGRDVAGQSMRAGGATALASSAVAPSLIQAIGHWSSATFQIYIRKHPVMLQALLYGRSARAPDERVQLPFYAPTT
ncbi:hypothetical protein D9615_005641 [Tricholomella constricta]|uniref:Tyr recombinase domain-containing protein n=1 Tax=Tricholomella constricta TaxID=117010 RepID=A0A8H5M5S9_9AGAR|nr:hypothetical protein D9615_005641 [Tricholomella constricta]